MPKGPEKSTRLSEGRVDQVGQQAANDALEFLNKHRDLIDYLVIAQIIEREKDAARSAYLEARKKGRANEDGSENPGITIFVTDEGKNSILSVCEGAGYPVSEDQFQLVLDNTWKFRFPRGAYAMGWGGAQFYQEAGTGGEKSQKPFSLRYNNVIRVEGDSGELWQNWHHSWDEDLLQE